MASMWGHVEVVRLLLDAGASVDFVGADGWTALDLARQEEHRGVFRSVV